MPGPGPPAFSASGRNTGTLRLTRGYFGLSYLAKEHGALEKRLADQGIKVEWIGPFPIPTCLRSST
ncbi:hypothetical protein [Ancylobacter amanitiformis]|uniref:Uncharacterized protein n=1 Tax=Ancylobacter amanitiformis TaxID=217069 RepID=A0ABU0LXG3_9HYPH|nr:hypothetical protein [Ancylobacter amanitiformis]MDQ0513384.1 hypothetical protein [Ancylobacter amanitiformis]